LHRMRFGDSLTVTLSVTPEVMKARIPALLLQPLADNAIRHGIAGRASGGRITVSGRLVDGKLEILVIDDGVGLPPNWRMASAQGQGLSVTRERMLAMYPATESEFAVRRRAEGGTEARISLPLDRTREDRHAHAIA
jgi:two-component system LytT family sensor kinase